MKMWKVYVILVFVMMLWGFNLPMLKYLVAQIGPVTMTSFRILLASLVVFIILAGMKILRLPTKQEWKWIMLGGLLNVVGHHYFLTQGLTQTSGTNAGLILGTGPVLTAILTSLILRNYPSKIQWLGVVSGLIGVSFIILAGEEGVATGSIGDFLVFLAILVQVLSYLVISKAARTLDPRVMTAYMFLFGSVVLFIISVIQEPGELMKFGEVPHLFWLIFATSAIFSTAIGHMLYNQSVGIAGPSKAAIFINFNTFFSLLGSVLFLGEVIGLRHFVGLIFIVIGVLLGSGAAEDLWKKRKEKKVIS